MNNSLQTNKVNNFLRCCMFIQDSRSLPLITVSLFRWIWVREVNAQKSAFSAAARGWCLAEGTAVWTALCVGYQGMPTESLFVCFTGRTGGEGFFTCTEMYFLLMLYNVLPSFESPGTFLCSLLTSSSSYKTWLEERENRWRLNFSASHSALAASSHPAALLLLLPPPLHLPNKKQQVKN